MEESTRREAETALEGKTEATKIYYREYAAMLEKYIALLNQNRFNSEVWRGLQREMMDKIETHYAAYVNERAAKDLPSEVGRVICGPRA